MLPWQTAFHVYWEELTTSRAPWRKGDQKLHVQILLCASLALPSSSLLSFQYNKTVIVKNSVLLSSVGHSGKCSSLRVVMGPLNLWLVSEVRAFLWG